MKPTSLAVAAVIVCLAATTAQAQNGYLTALGRHLGYGISDGYHVQRFCQCACACGNCSPLPSPVLKQPLVTSAHAQSARYKPHSAVHRLGYPGTSMYELPWNSPNGAGYPTTTTPYFVTPNQRRSIQMPR